MDHWLCLVQEFYNLITPHNSPPSEQSPLLDQCPAAMKLSDTNTALSVSPPASLFESLELSLSASQAYQVPSSPQTSAQPKTVHRDRVRAIIQEALILLEDDLFDE